MDCECAPSGWAHFWEAVTLLGFILMSGELFTPDKKRLNSRWNSIGQWLAQKSIPRSHQAYWSKLARKHSFLPIVVASWFIWVPVITVGVVFSIMANMPWGNSSLASELFVIAMFGLPALFFLWGAWIGFLILMFHFLERSRNIDNPYFIGLQLGAYLTIAAQVRKVIFP
jgi:hypothetical protein